MFNQVPLVCFYFHYSMRWVIGDLAVIYVIDILPLLSSKSFIVSGLTFRSLIHFEFIFVYGVRKRSNLIFYVQLHSFPSTTYWRLLFPHCIFLPLLSKIRFPQVHGFISGLSVLYHCSISSFLVHSQLQGLWLLSIVDTDVCLSILFYPS